MIRCLIVDDEQLIRELVEDNIRQISFLHLVKSYKNALEALDVLEREKIDLIYLDIHLPGLSGLQFLQSLPERPLIILITAYEKYALEGFDFNAVDYVLKPFSFERFLKASNRANELFKLKQGKATTNPEAPCFFVHVEYMLVKINVLDIVYIEGLKDYIKIFLSSSPKPVLTRMTMKAIEEKLPPGTLIRSHKSYLVAVNKITVVKRNSVCLGEKEIPVSEFYKDNLHTILRPEN